MTTRSEDKWDAMAAEKLPCFRCGELEDAMEHGDDCPAHYRPAVAAALREMWDKGGGEFTCLLCSEKHGMMIIDAPTTRRDAMAYLCGGRMKRVRVFYDFGNGKEEVSDWLASPLCPRHAESLGAKTTKLKGWPPSLAALKWLADYVAHNAAILART